MQISALKEFIVLAETLNFSAAAKMLYISQSVLSKHIMALEHELDAKLLLRGNHSVSLSQQGDAFLKRAKTIIDEYNQALEELQNMNDGIESTLKVGYLFNSEYELLNKSILRFHEEHPQVRISVTALEVSEIVKRVQTGELDVGITISPLGSINSLETMTLHRDHYGIICLRNHPLARRSSISIKDLKNVPILTPSPKAMTAEHLITEQIFEGCGCTPRLFAESEGIGSIYPFLITGRGVALAPSHIETIVGDDCRFVPFSDVSINTDLVTCWKSGCGRRAIIEFANCVKEASMEME